MHELTRTVSICGRHERNQRSQKFALALSWTKKNSKASSAYLCDNHKPLLSWQTSRLGCGSCHHHKLPDFCYQAGAHSGCTAGSASSKWNLRLTTLNAMNYYTMQKTLLYKLFLVTAFAGALAKPRKPRRPHHHFLCQWIVSVWQWHSIHWVACGQHLSTLHTVPYTLYTPQCTQYNVCCVHSTEMHSTCKYMVQYTWHAEAFLYILYTWNSAHLLDKEEQAIDWLLPKADAIPRP